MPDSLLNVPGKSRQKSLSVAPEDALTAANIQSWHKIMFKYLPCPWDCDVLVQMH